MNFFQVGFDNINTVKKKLISLSNYTLGDSSSLIPSAKIIDNYAFSTTWVMGGTAENSLSLLSLLSLCSKAPTMFSCFIEKVYKSSELILTREKLYVLDIGVGYVSEETIEAFEKVIEGKNLCYLGVENEPNCLKFMKKSALNYETHGSIEVQYRDEDIRKFLDGPTSLDFPRFNFVVIRRPNPYAENIFTEVFQIPFN